METIEELTEFLRGAVADGARARLQARGEARALMRQDGALPDDAPSFGNTIDTDLAEYGLSILRGALALREKGGDPAVWRLGFTRAGNAFEALIQNGSPEDLNRGFYRIAGAAAYHLASYSALAYSLIGQALGDSNSSPAEEAIALLIVRDLAALRNRSMQWLQANEHQDVRIAELAQEGVLDPDDLIQIVLTSAVFRAFAYFEFALQTGAATLVETADQILRQASTLATSANAVTMWWTIRIARNLLDDLWGSSLHQLLPVEGPANALGYPELRKLLLAELYARKAAEVELWPSQLEAARRATNLLDNLVVALPTSAGKTRIAEIATLMTLAVGMRVVIVTPLRALSAQTERSFRKTFAGLGCSVSSLYGSSGAAVGDEDAIRSSRIVIATPEKLDFALRNDRSIINDVGLVILDEGHLIGPSDREIRYENLVQRLLRRADAANRRIVCLSAILPEGEDLDDLTAWIRRDQPGTPIQSSWRPTRQRYGTLTWQGQSGRLGFDLEAAGPFIRHFIQQQQPLGRRRSAFPNDTRELTLAAAWKFHSQGKRTLIYCTQRDHVEGYAKAIVDLSQRGYLEALIEDQPAIQRAMAVGREWLGADHPAVRCLPLGVAIHHGRLPSPFLREVEALLSANVLRVTVASPTLAQGLNLNAAVLLIPSLFRSGNPLTGEEFANVAGRAGRAFVDMEGLILHVMYAPEAWRIRDWRALVNSAKSRSLHSGLVTIIATAIDRLARSGVLMRADAAEFLASNADAWYPEDLADDSEPIEELVEKLDATVFGLIEALDAESDQLPQLIDEALTGSLWARQVGRLGNEASVLHKWILQARANLIWRSSNAMQRRAIFSMGVGFESGLAIDRVAGVLTEQLDLADVAALQGDVERLVGALAAMAEQLFQIRPFIPEHPVPEWRNLLRSWVAGADVATLGVSNLRFIEDAFAYRLVWAIEAIRMRRRSMGGDGEVIDGAAAAALETGVPRTMMAMLIRSGLPSREAAMAAINSTNPVFTTPAEMRAWLTSQEVLRLTARPDWPTPSTVEIWRRFLDMAVSARGQRWISQVWPVAGPVAIPEFAEASIPHRVQVNDVSNEVSVLTPDFRPVYSIRQRLNQQLPSLLQATISADRQSSTIYRIGPGEARWVDEL
ncbi:DEAD/DEAH box helicase [Dyella sp.]|uniref:DEAD/DEAH box helicase n=1 Tax=Dyella sp. TaxID=1869338 RepID=UPI002B46FF9E|nr:DEAD/DEAH box helicase [Dyella sp.]HKT26792.1 DEAD/DEAH box helicase [Dyella sp.]